MVVFEVEAPANRVIGVGRRHGVAASRTTPPMATTIAHIAVAFFLCAFLSRAADAADAKIGDVSLHLPHPVGYCEMDPVLASDGAFIGPLWRPTRRTRRSSPCRAQPLLLGLRGMSQKPSGGEASHPAEWSLEGIGNHALEMLWMRLIWLVLPDALSSTLTTMRSVGVRSLMLLHL